MRDSTRLDKARDLLLKHRQKIRANYEFPGLTEANNNMNSANTFFLGAVMDYQMEANDVWRNTEELVDRLGAEDLWKTIASMSEERWRRLRKEDGGYFHRFWDAEGNLSVAAKQKRIAKNIVRQFGGDVRTIWRDRTTDEVYEVLRNDVQVNLGTSDATIRMIVLALEEYGLIEGSTSVKPDSNVKRVLGRVFDGEPIRRDDDAVDLARRIYPQKPGKIDLPLFDIGKTHCRKSKPLCDSGCPLNAVCRYYKGS